jgi:hypothetical protein
MTYSEIKKEMESPEKLSKEKLSQMYDEIREIIYDAEHGKNKELEPFLSDIYIYGEFDRKGISIDSEPSKIKKDIMHLL